MEFPECRYCKVSNRNRNIFFKRKNIRVLEKHLRMLPGGLRDVQGNIMFFTKSRNPSDMIGMFVRNKYGFHFLHRNVKALHSLLNFPAGNSQVNQNGGFLIPYIIAVSVTSRIQRPKFNCHEAKIRNALRPARKSRNNLYPLL